MTYIACNLYIYSITVNLSVGQCNLHAQISIQPSPLNTCSRNSVRCCGVLCFMQQCCSLLCCMHVSATAAVLRTPLLHAAVLGPPLLHAAVLQPPLLHAAVLRPPLLHAPLQHQHNSHLSYNRAHVYKTRCHF